MRYALLSDVHANLPALTAVLDAIKATPGVDATWHLGDLVGYAPWPNEVVDVLAQSGIGGVAGNYDSTVAFDYMHCGCRAENPAEEALAHRSFEWTKAHVTLATKAFLGALPFRVDLRPAGGHISHPTVTLLHGNHVLNTVYVHQERSDVFLQGIGDGVGAKAGDVVAMGHTHVAWHREVNGVHYVNTGSVGRPKDGDWRAGWVLLDVTAGSVSVEFKRVKYDVDAAVAAILGSELPHEFAAVLRSGGKA
ncbi:MAG TPA: metallophosphoesterase family protein [Gemmatimonadales bacterium]